ncbi:hypothetical protein [Deminuibacter soli]|uniref:DUF3829 domain-containing protein n=1 Tax=Deminuibacter soli TaxID=2291815 RepID=A0A3E1NJA9_9BACT|nr:hypothetical protein [Deminuibacter soli]RFM28019.1 hypothetical protein DXN05_10785 [Deminuibacter soli]
MTQKLRSAALLLLLIATLHACVNIKAVDTYATGALENITQFDNTGYSFQQACADSCKLQRYFSLQLQTTPCPCESNKKADAGTRKIYEALKAYFTALSKLAGKDASTYKVTALGTSLNESGLISSTPYKKEVVNAYSKISEVLLHLITDGYRSRKLKQVIEQSNGPVDTLLHYLSFAIATNLSGKLQVKAARLQYDIYPEMMRHAATDFEKKKVIDEYDDTMAAIAAKQALLETFGKALEKTAAGHRQLYNNRNRLTAKDVQEATMRYANDLGDLYNEFNTIKNADK